VKSEIKKLLQLADTKSLPQAEYWPLVFQQHKEIQKLKYENKIHLSKEETEECEHLHLCKSTLDELASVRFRYHPLKKIKLLKKLIDTHTSL